MRQGQRNAAPPRSVNVQVAVRCRPLNERERVSGERAVLSCAESRREVMCNAIPGQRKGASAVAAAAKKTYTFDHVFGPDASQADVYEGVVEPIVDEVLQGYNCTVFAYGQTGTGKTHTMEGRRDVDAMQMAERRLPGNAGIIPRAVKQVFDHLRSITDEHSVRVSHLELYNEQLTDLLEPEVMANDSLRMYEDPHKGTFVQGLDDIVVRSEEDIFAILDKSAAKRRTAETLMNKYSSRSHSVFSITIHIKESTPDGADLLKVGKLNLVDLAGSENVGRSGAVKGRAREAGNINQSLLTLGRVITALVDRHPHIPYRDSKLTRLLQESLGGRNKTCVIATVTPGSSSVEETASTLDYAYRAKSIKNRPTVNQMIAKHVLLKEYTEEISKLKRELEASRTKNGVYLPPDEFHRLQANSTQQSESITELMLRNEEYEKRHAALREKHDRVTDALAREQIELAQTREELGVTKEDLHKTRQTLVATTQQKEEARYLVVNHASAEAKLYDEGCHLQSAVSNCLKDIDALQTRVEVKAGLEKENVDATVVLRGAVAAGASSLKTALVDFGIEQQRALSVSGSDLRGVSVELGDGVESVVAQLQSVRKLMEDADATHAEKQSELEAENSLENKTTINNTENDIRAQVQCLDDVHGTVSKACGTAQKVLEKLRGQVEALSSGIEQRNQEQLMATSKFMNVHECLVAKLAADVKDQLDMQAAALGDVQTSVSAQLEAQRHSAVKAQQEAVSQITQALSALTQQHAEASLATMDVTREKVGAAQECTASIETSVTKHVSCLTDAVASHEKSDNLRSVANDDLVSANRDSVGVEVTSAQQNLSQSVEHFSQLVHVERQRDATLLNSLTKYQDSLAGQAERRMRGQEQAAAANKALTESEFTDLRSKLDGVVKGAHAKHLHVSSALGGIEKDLIGFVQDAEAIIDTNVKEPVESFGIQTDGEHGSAPPRRHWVYPEELTTTNPHDALIREFRTQNGLEPVPFEPFANQLVHERSEKASESADEAQKESSLGEDDPHDEASASPPADGNEVDDVDTSMYAMDGERGSIAQPSTSGANSECSSVASNPVADEALDRGVLRDETNIKTKTRTLRATAKSKQAKASGIPAPPTRRSKRKVEQ